MVKSLFCKHDYKFDSNTYGDCINFTDGARTILKCARCGKYKYIHDFLVPNEKAPQHTSDGYHTFDELYYHRMMLFSVICNTYKDKAWKSLLHDDGTMYDNYFIVGVSTNEGDYTYHYHIKYWDMFNVTELKQAPKWDGHKPSDITRLLNLRKGK